MPVLAVIPARLASTRLPEKPLARIAGKAMVVHVLERAKRARTVDACVVATDSDKVLKAVKAAGGEAVMTDESHKTGTDRIAEVVRMEAFSRYELVVNVQGDEPLLDADTVDACVEAARSEGTDVGTVAAPLLDERDLANPNVVKVVAGHDGRALYFSRAPIPFQREGASLEAWKVARRHIGLYGYRREALLRLAGLAPSPLEQVEMLEQLRMLQNGMRIQVAEVARAQAGVDTAEDLERVRKILEAQG
jgi:3-deoxy-manno-octulosonate cytidylyltransferase (CMP-KDO synthetase)